MKTGKFYLQYRIFKNGRAVRAFSPWDYEPENAEFDTRSRALEYARAHMREAREALGDVFQIDIVRAVGEFSAEVECKILSCPRKTAQKLGISADIYMGKPEQRLLSAEEMDEFRKFIAGKYPQTSRRTRIYSAELVSAWLVDLAPEYAEEIDIFIRNRKKSQK